MRILSILVKIIGGLLLLFLLLVLFVRSPWGQDIIKNKAVSYLADKTHTTISLDRLYITFGGNIAVEGLYIEDQNQDTLLYSRSLTADIPLWPILRGSGVSVDYLDWEGVRANVYRKNEVDDFNYQFLLDAFIGIDTTQSTAVDTASSTTDISIGEIVLDDIKAMYKDDVSGMDAMINIGSFSIEMDRTDFAEFRFEVGEAALENSKVRYVQTKPFPVSEDTSSTPLPYLALNDIEIKNVSVVYRSEPDGIDAEVDIHTFGVKAPVVDLAGNDIHVESINLDHSKIHVNMIKQPSVDTASTQRSSQQEAIAFAWPDWQVKVDDIDLQDNSILYQLNGAKPQSGYFNPDALALTQFMLTGENIIYAEKSTTGHLAGLSFREGSGVRVDKMELHWDMDDRQMNISDLHIQALKSQVSGSLSAGYASVGALINQPDRTVIDVDFPTIDVDVDEFYRFQPDLRENPYVAALAEKSLNASLQAKGRLASLRIPEASLQWGDQTAVFASGVLYHPTEPERLRFDFPDILIRSTRSDLNHFIDEDSLGVRYPEEARITADMKGSMYDATVEAFLESTLGHIALQGSYSSADSLAFTSDIKATNLQLDTLLQNQQMGSLTFTVQARGQGRNINNLNAAFTASVDSFSYNQYSIRDWTLEGDIINGQGKLMSAYQDSNLNISLEADIVLDSISPEINADLHVMGVDLAALGVMDKQIKMAFEAEAGFKGNIDSFHTSLTVRNGTVLYNDNVHPTGMVKMNAYVAPDTTSGSIHSRMLDLVLESNTSPAGFTTAIFRHIQGYLTDTIYTTDSISMPVNVTVSGSMREDPLLSEVFLSGLQEMDTLDLGVEFNEADRSLTAHIDIPYLNYSGVEIDSLGLSADSDAEFFAMDLGLREVIAGPVTITRTYFTNEVRNQTLYSHFEARYKDLDLIHFKTETSQVNDSLRIHFDPSDLVFDAKEWDIPATNLIRIGENKIEFKDFRIQSGEQKLAIDDNPGPNDLNIVFEEFSLANIISYFNPDSLLATGSLNGRITVEEPLGDAGLIADLKINDFHVMEVDMGVMSLYGETEDARNYEANIKLNGGEVDLNADVEYHATDSDSDVELDMTIDRISMVAVQSFSMGAVSGSAGYISGLIRAEGSLSDLAYDGQLVFHEASVTPAMLQTPFRLGSQQINFDNEGINLAGFEVSDEDGNTFSLDGEINTEDIFNPAFDLTMQANDFQVLNATEQDNDLFYGKASFDANATLTGDLNLPVLDLQLEVGSGTDVTYIMPQGEAALNRREGIVEFVNKENPDAIMSDEDEESVVITGYDINAVVSVGEDAAFKVIISKQTGDHFKISGNGDLNFTMDRAGRMSLSGLYTLSDGHYEMNLYNLVNRRFDVAQGSTVSWSGDPFNASMDVRAIYTVETSPASLMAAQTSGADPSVQNQFRRKLPFLVYLNVDGELSEPKLTFSLDMPEDVRGEMGGQVYGRIQQINQQEDILNKQVFSLLVLGRFYPDSGSDGSSGGIVNVARDNLNQALSDQLNMFSDKLLGDTGLELDFGLDSYTDYQGQSAQNRTQLDIAAQKKFLDDRLIVKVGSEVDIEGGNANPQEENPLIGNVSVEYLLTEDGKFRIRGFRKNVYENVIDGQTIVSGIALIFTREFNKFSEMWAPLLQDKSKEEKAEEEK